MPLNASKTGILVFFLLLSFPKKCDKILFAVKIQGMRKEFFMSRRGENIFKRKDGRGEARYIHHYENSVAKYRYLYADSYAEVKQKRLDELSMPQNCVSERSKSLATTEQLAAVRLIDIRPDRQEVHLYTVLYDRGKAHSSHAWKLCTQTSRSSHRESIFR